MQLRLGVRAQRLQQLLIPQEPVADEDLAEAPLVGLLLEQRAEERLLVDQPVAHEGLTDRLARVVGARPLDGAVPQPELLRGRAALELEDARLPPVQGPAQEVEQVEGMEVAGEAHLPDLHHLAQLADEVVGGGRPQLRPRVQPAEQQLVHRLGHAGRELRRQGQRNALRLRERVGAGEQVVEDGAQARRGRRRARGRPPARGSSATAGAPRARRPRPRSASLMTPEATITFDGRSEPWTRPRPWRTESTCAPTRPRACTCWKPSRRPLAIASAKLRPSTHSPTTQRWPCHSMNAITFTTFGCDSCAAALRSAASAGEQRAVAGEELVGDEAHRDTAAVGHVLAAVDRAERSAALLLARHEARRARRGRAGRDGRSLGGRRRGRGRRGGRGGGTAVAERGAGARRRGAAASAGCRDGRWGGGRRAGRQAHHALVHVAELQVLGLDPLVDRQRGVGLPGRLLGEREPVVEVEVADGDRLAADRLQHALAGEGGAARLDEEPREQLRRRAVVVVGGRHALQEGDRLLAIARAARRPRRS